MCVRIKLKVKNDKNKKATPCTVLYFGKKRYKWFIPPTTKKRRSKSDDEKFPCAFTCVCVCMCMCVCLCDMCIMCCFGDSVV